MIFAILGQSGQLARALKRQARFRGHKTYSYSRLECDLSDPADIIEQFVLSLPCDVQGVIIAAAYTQVDQAETETDLAFKVNADAPAIIGRACKERGLPVVHISTDYVFSGDGNTPYCLTDTVDPVNIYGASKLVGERGLVNSGARAIILRTSWVFDGMGANFLTTMLRLSETQDELSVVSDQLGRPTYAGHLADATLIALEHLCRSPEIKTLTFHVTGSGPVISWADFARAIFAAANRSMRVKNITTLEYPTLAVRPAYSALDITDFENEFGIALPDWHQGLKDALQETEPKKE